MSDEATVRDVLSWLSERQLTARVRKPGDACACCERPLPPDRFVVELWHGNTIVGGGGGGSLPEAYAVAQTAFDERVRSLMEGT